MTRTSKRPQVEALGWKLEPLPCHWPAGRLWTDSHTGQQSPIPTLADRNIVLNIIRNVTIITNKAVGMARSVWQAPKDINAHNEGYDAAAAGFPRKPRRTYTSYDERAAFNDGWDSYQRGFQKLPTHPVRLTIRSR